jgi:hypothetical protein
MDRASPTPWALRAQRPPPQAGEVKPIRGAERVNQDLPPLAMPIVLNLVVKACQSDQDRQQAEHPDRERAGAHNAGREDPQAKADNAHADQVCTRSIHNDGSSAIRVLRSSGAGDHGCSAKIPIIPRWVETNLRDRALIPPVNPCRGKYSSSLPPQIISRTRAVLPTEGRIAIVTDAGPTINIVLDLPLSIMVEHEFLTDYFLTPCVPRKIRFGFVLPNLGVRP